jgi:tRNA(fMet)-specific endonuclease VapC
MKYALDANIIIKYLRNDEKTVKKVDKTLADGVVLFIPRVVDYEVRRGFRIKPSFARQGLYYELLEKCEILEISKETWEYAIDVYSDLYHKRFSVERADILIAAICLENGCILITNNTMDFSNVNGLEAQDWTV